MSYVLCDIISIMLSSYDFRIVFRADEVEVFDPETNTWVKYKNKKRLINNSNSKRFLNKLTPLIGDNKKTEEEEKKDTVPKSATCTRTEYREEYIPGTKSNPGYVKSYEVDIVVPCGSQSQDDKIDNDDCSKGSVIGGLLGAGIALSSSKGKDRFWAVPAGGNAGSLIGCQVDGG